MDAPDGAETRALEAKIRKLGRVIRALLAEEPAKTQAALQANGIQDLQAFLSPDYVLEDEEEENLKEAYLGR
ncbi:hypothetical protein FB45DRAFT_1028145 [Roridomyces roridus]|uniref:Uncharacterized protein n=1 Tax=Roridomyces roridus TaxID=1738132 RepID=A0AAD7BVP0_9AGAR|nr:hypothetical protein FB45DRAFT_1028145 [Roridomyces roridus]